MSHNTGKPSVKTVEVTPNETYVIWMGNNPVPVVMKEMSETEIPIDAVLETMKAFSDRAKKENTHIPSRPME